ncbi:hypothetical protein Mapa_015410 [Marchantia paleacea]|nr:hypothetical protein Mapa_015410 [Marchantia paleacea]
MPLAARIFTLLGTLHTLERKKCLPGQQLVPERSSTVCPSLHSFFAHDSGQNPLPVLRVSSFSSSGPPRRCCSHTCSRLKRAVAVTVAEVIGRAGMGESSGVISMKPLFSFGLVADVQYADKDNKGPDEEGRVQRYREATGKLEKAVKAFNANKQNLQFVLTLGDIIDGNVTVQQTESDFDEVLTRLAKLELKVYHLLGNHCLRLPRETLLEKLGMPALYYQKQIHPGWTLIVLDSMDLSITWPTDTEKYKDGLKFCQEHPIVEDKSTQMASWNGGLGAEQLAWFAGVLREAEREGTKVIVAAHHPLLSGSAPFSHLMWNHDQVSSILLASPSVVLFLCGHYHPGGYVRVGGQHFVTVQAILEAPPDSEAHAFVHVYKDHITIEGYGFVESRNLTIA